MTVTPATAELFTDETLPTLSAAIDPADAANTFSWTSSDPTVIAVNATTGALTFSATDIPEESKVVTITAQAANGEKGTCAITVKGQIARYGVIDCSAEVGLQILDRNVGATAAYDPDKNANNDGAIGNFYQWGKNTVVATGAETTVNANFVKTWNATGDGFSDWSVAANTPCPIGWGIPTQTQFKAITNITSNYDDLMLGEGWISQDEYDDAKALYDKMLLMGTGTFVVNTDQSVTKKTLMLKAEFLWTSTLNTTDAPDASGIKYVYTYCYNNFATINKKDFVNWAMPIRCVKAVAVQ